MPDSRTLQERVLVVDDDADLLSKLRLMLLTASITDIRITTDPRAVAGMLAEEQACVLVMDWIMPGMTGSDLLNQMLAENPGIPVIVLTALNDVQTAVECMRRGAFDFITKPVDPNRFIASVRRAFQMNELNRQNRALRERLLDDAPARAELFGDIVTESRQMERIFRYIEAVAPSSNPVLITGESGVGKELFARAIHRVSGLSGDFVPLNVAGLDDLMFADALFGHRKGAYTGASDARDGLLRKAENGTIFLDEIGDLSLDSQIKLLRLLQEKEYYRLGSDTLCTTNARIVAATNKNFTQLISEGKFRLDLYHRLCGHEFTIPPLRKRPGDIVPLLRRFILRTAQVLEKEPPAIDPQLLEALQRYPFPGNIRELENRTVNAVTANITGTLGLADFPGIHIPPPQREKTRITFDPDAPLQFSFTEFPTLAAVEQLLIDAAMQRTGGNKTAAAELLGVSRMTLTRRG